jgi:3-methyladenine DNA glycosylase AlkC
MEPLKYMFSPALIEQIGTQAAHSIPGFSQDLFITHVLNHQWDALELKQRVRHISTALHAQMSGHYPTDIQHILHLTHAILQSSTSQSFVYMFLPDYIEQYGTQHLSLSLQAMEAVTCLCSCEFAIRPFLLAHQQQVLAQMLLWSTHPNAHVRRLSSEGCRPRLPWGMAMPALKKDPTPILPILENLKNDPSEYVRKSVANNLNDITKDNPDVVLALGARWLGTSPHTNWIVKHACRTLLKKGNIAALQLFGLSHQPLCTVDNLSVANSAISIGQHLHFSFSLTSHHAAPTTMRVEYIITYAKANDKQSNKVFKITENTYHPHQPTIFTRRQSFADMTTRKHYPGTHHLTIAINGCHMASLAFQVVS